MSEKHKKRVQKLRDQGCADCTRNVVWEDEAVYEIGAWVFCAACHEDRSAAVRAVMVLLRKEKTEEIHKLAALLSLSKPLDKG